MFLNISAVQLFVFPLEHQNVVLQIQLPLHIFLPTNLIWLQIGLTQRIDLPIVF